MVDYEQNVDYKWEESDSTDEQVAHEEEKEDSNAENAMIEQSYIVTYKQRIMPCHLETWSGVCMQHKDLRLVPHGSIKCTFDSDVVPKQPNYMSESRA